MAKDQTREDARTGGATADSATADSATLERLVSELEPEPMRTITITLPREDAWCFEQTKMLARHVVGGAYITDAEAMFGLVAETTSTLCGELPRNAIELPDDDDGNSQRAWAQELAKMRTEAEVRCEANFHRCPEPENARSNDGDSDSDESLWGDAESSRGKARQRLSPGAPSRKIAHKGRLRRPQAAAPRRVMAFGWLTPSHTSLRRRTPITPAALGRGYPNGYDPSA